MQLAPDIGREVLCRLSPLVNHVEILSRPRLGQVPWQSHATAKILRDCDCRHAPRAGGSRAARPLAFGDGRGKSTRWRTAAGLHYGPTYQKLLRAAAVRPDRIALDLTDEEADPAFGVDPARLDSCFHALVLILSSLRDAVHGTAYIPVRFGEIMLRRPGQDLREGPH